MFVWFPIIIIISKMSKLMQELKVDIRHMNKKMDIQSQNIKMLTEHVLECSAQLKDYEDVIIDHDYNTCSLLIGDENIDEDDDDWWVMGDNYNPDYDD